MTVTNKDQHKSFQMIEKVGKLKCAVCPKCGFAETYIQDTSKIKKLTLNNKEK